MFYLYLFNKPYVCVYEYVYKCAYVLKQYGIPHNKAPLHIIDVALNSNMFVRANAIGIYCVRDVNKRTAISKFYIKDFFVCMYVRYE